MPTLENKVRWLSEDWVIDSIKHGYSYLNPTALVAHLKEHQYDIDEKDAFTFLIEFAKKGYIEPFIFVPCSHDKKTILVDHTMQQNNDGLFHADMSEVLGVVAVCPSCGHNTLITRKNTYMAFRATREYINWVKESQTKGDS